MAKLKLHGIEPVPVDLNGTEFNAVPATKKVAEALDEAWRAYMEAEGTDATLDALGDLFDLRLQPIDGAEKKASVIVKEMWEADQATFPQLISFLNEAAAEADRPTQGQ